MGYTGNTNFYIPRFSNLYYNSRGESVYLSAERSTIISQKHEKQLPNCFSKYVTPKIVLKFCKVLIRFRAQAQYQIELRFMVISFMILTTLLLVLRELDTGW